MTDVQIETEPVAAAEIAGDRIDVLRAFASDLGERGETLGLIGPLEPPRLWTRHLLNSAILAPLIEPMERRCAWLNEQVERLGLENVEVKRGRAEEFHDAFEVDQLTARAVTALRKLVPLAAPLLRDGGELLLLKGDSVQGEIDAAEKVLRKHKVRDISTEILGEGLLADTTRVFRARVR